MKNALVVALLLASSAAWADISINASLYFAYAHLPARGTSVSTYVLLSDQPCQTANAPKGAKKAALKDRYMERPACWDSYKGVVLVCPATSEKGKLGSACTGFSEEKFIDVNSLPVRAKF